MSGKIYARKTMSGHNVLSKNFTDLSFEELEIVAVTSNNFDQLLDKLDDVREYARRNPTTAPQCVLDLVEDLANH